VIKEKLEEYKDGNNLICKALEKDNGVHSSDENIAGEGDRGNEEIPDEMPDSA
jgi:hypothetical protein